MIDLLAPIKLLVVCFTLVGSSVVDKLSPHEYTQEEINAIRIKVESRVEEMRADVDGSLGAGVFDGIVSGEIDVKEFLECEDLEKFLMENGCGSPPSEQTGQQK